MVQEVQTPQNPRDMTLTRALSFALPVSEEGIAR
jgi:hypothetical protein